MNLELCKQEFSEEEISEVLASLTSGFVTMGDKVSIFEEKFAEYIGVEHAVMVNSGSSANLLMTKALSRDIRKNAIVLVPALSWSTTLWPVLQSGLNPILMDVDLETMNIGAEQLDKSLREAPSAEVLMAVHIMGNPVPMRELEPLMWNRPMHILEDSCETLGSEHYCKKTGNFGDAASYSFFYSHHMTTIEGGMVVTNNNVMAERIRVMRSHGWSRGIMDGVLRREIEAQEPMIDPRFLFIEGGFNLRPTELNAALGIHQLAKLDERNGKRLYAERRMRDMVNLYDIKPIKITDGSEAFLFAFPVILPNRERRDGLSRHLESHGIQTRPIVAGNLMRHPGISRQVAGVGNFPNADRIAECGMYWGLHPYITDEQLNHLEKTIAGYFKGVKAA